MNQEKNSHVNKVDNPGAIEKGLERFIFNSRWILTIFYVFLVLTLAILAIKFLQEFVHFSMSFWDASEAELLSGILGLVDKTLLANLLILVIFSGYENFVSIIGAAKDSDDRPSWMGEVDFAGLKLKLIGSIVALSGINLLAAFLEISTTSKEDSGWMIGIHLVFVLTAVLFALSERIMIHNRK